MLFELMYNYNTDQWYPVDATFAFYCTAYILGVTTTDWDHRFIVVSF